jgi:signal transduction histidine kinase
VQQHELNLQKSNFVSSVSHELRAPLGSIRLLAEGLERGTVTDADRRLEYFRLIGQETRRLGSLVENVLDFSRIEQGRKQYEFEPTRIDALLHRTVETFEPLAKERGVRLEVVVPDSGPPLELPADGRALQQALLNLLDNALKHSPEGARIRVQLELHPAPLTEGRSPTAFSQLRLSVTDSGPGIPAADHERIFEPFFRRGSELRRDTQGVGIGLSIVRHILEAHGGRIDLVSQPGQGATFTLVLPVPSSTPTLTPTPCDS